jgi:acetylornithine deacetylase/succinyl-diaminopimelate desuccinylase-like protein
MLRDNQTGTSMQQHQPTAGPNRQHALGRAAAHWTSGDFLHTLAQLVAVPTESQEARGGPHLAVYLTDHIRPRLEQIGFAVEVLVNPAPAGPLLLAERIEDPDLPTVLIYGHGDVIRGQERRWSEGLNPWQLVEREGRVYGRGVSDNKGQHLINIAALGLVLAERGRLGFNVRFLMETAEEVGSPGLRETCSRHRDQLSADLLIASDGPRLHVDRPSLFLGTRGALNFTLRLRLREGGHHSGNWGGLLANPAVMLSHAIAEIVSPHGEILIPELKPKAIPPTVRKALAEIEVIPEGDDPVVDASWGEPGLSAAEKVFGWSSFEVLAMVAGEPENPVNAVPPSATAHCQIRYTVDTDPATFLPAIRARLSAAGLDEIEVGASEAAMFRATRTDPDHHWVRFAVRSIERTTGKPPDILPNSGGSLPNDCFAELLEMPTIWVPHSHRGCQQHAPDEHALAQTLREGLAMMTGLFFDLGDHRRAS